MADAPLALPPSTTPRQKARNLAKMDDYVKSLDRDRIRLITKLKVPGGRRCFLPLKSLRRRSSARRERCPCPSSLDQSPIPPACRFRESRWCTASMRRSIELFAPPQP